MALHIDHLSIEQLRELLESAVSLLPTTSRRRFMETIPTPAVPPPPSEKALARVVEVAEGLEAFLDDHSEEAAVWLNGDDWSHNEDFDDELGAWQGDLDEALKDAVAWLATQKPTERISRQLAEVMEAIEALNGWECEYATGITYGELDTAPVHLEPFRIWATLMEQARSKPTDIAADLVATWPHPTGTSLLVAALGAKKAAQVTTALTAIADQGGAAAARWLLLARPDDEALLTLYAHLAADLGQRWSAKMAQEKCWGEIMEGLDRGVAVPHDVQYQAALQLKRYPLAFRDVFETFSRVPISQVWDDAVAAGKLDLLRQIARSSARGVARWVALDEPDLLQLPQKYDHSAVKAVVSYSVARASKGRIKSEAHAYELDEALLARLANAPGPHDEAGCVDTALAGLEQMMAFHIAGRSRNRYARAAAYWAQHGVLCETYGLLPRHARLRTVFVAELHRLPALRDELNQAKAAWR